MTLVCNRSTAKHARRTTALANLRILPQEEWAFGRFNKDGHSANCSPEEYNKYVARKEQERATLMSLTAQLPMIERTKKSLRSASLARRARHAGKGI